MRNAFAAALAKAADLDERVVILAADISPAGPLAEFADRYPRRFVNVGVAECTMIGMAAGMALAGLRPFCYTIATFALYRPFEFVRDDLAYQKLPVTVVGMGAALNYSTLGATHHATEDVAVASAIPGMQVLAPCDPAETADCVQWCAVQQNGPVYLRIGKAGEPNLTSKSEPWHFGKLRYIRSGRDTCILSYGPTVATALRVAEAHDASVVCAHTLKPLDRHGIESLLQSYYRLIVIEEHSSRGSLGNQVKAIAWDAKVEGCEIRTMSLQDSFIHYHGDRDKLLEAHGLTEKRLVAFLHD